MRLLRSLAITALGSGLRLTLTQPAHASLTAGPDIIPVPASVVISSGAGGARHTHQQAFNGRQVVLVPAAGLTVDAGIVPAGTAVSSHMIFLNQPDCAPCSSLDDVGEVWSFSGPIIGVMSDRNGSHEAASTPLLGAPGTIYQAPATDRGLEPNDTFTVAGNTITVNMHVTQPGDWIRVVTQAVADDCKKGGWQSSPLGFKNQGDCV